MDTTDDNSIKQAVERVDGVVKEKGLTLLINNSGTNVRAPLESLTRDIMMENYSVNTVSTLMVIRAFLPLLERAASFNKGQQMGWTKSAVLSMSSILGCVGKPAAVNYGYGSSKAALNYINNVLKKQFEGSGIVVGVVHPGWVQTDMGGENAAVSPEESVKGVIKVLEVLDNKDIGGFYNYKGDTLPW